MKTMYVHGYWVYKPYRQAVHTWPVNLSNPIGAFKISWHLTLDPDDDDGFRDKPC